MIFYAKRMINYFEFIEKEEEGSVERVKIREAAELLGVSQQFIRIGMQRNQLPIGTAVKLSSRWTYYIPRERLNAYLKGQDIKNRSAATER